MHTATDCSYCKRWDSTFGGKGEFVKYAKSHPGVQMAVVERPAITTPERSNDYPENVRWLYSANEQRDALRPGTPLFEVFVGQKLVYKSYGTASWDSAVLPAVKELDSRRGVTSVSSLN
ncbi:hypothetical protein [Paraburkholderia sp.]|uniref:hypothetical protein n=1 Tax=Paraburkholderia sp. TaxID=1926495 RepID=UPI00239B15B9|nr:hypothetical protein [Paraburkholderia sp.]MDE1179300.1 hypothetical protein [Paraburkholderia sp.]